MKQLQKFGGVAAIYEALIYLITMIFFLLVMDYANIVDPVQKVQVIVENYNGVFLITTLSYIVFGFALIVLSLALYHRTKTGSIYLAQITALFGFIWAGLVIASGMVHNVGLGTLVDLYGQDILQAVSYWVVIDTVSLGLGGQMEIVGGIWMLLVTIASLRLKLFSKLFNYFAVAISFAGILSAFPGLTDLNMVFGLGQVVWFIGIGFLLFTREIKE